MGSDLYTLSLDGMDQSVVDLSDPTKLAFDYMRRIADVVDARPAGPQRILHIGGAAMTLPRYFAHTRPRSAQVVLEPNQAVIDQVRAEAPLPARSGVKVRPIDGAAGVAAIRENAFDVVILDAFAGAEVPAELVTGDFVAQLARVLDDGGVVLANITDRAPFKLVRDVVAALRASFGPELAAGAEPATLKAKRPGNVVLAAGEFFSPAFGHPSPTAYRTFDAAGVSDSFGGGRVRNPI